MQPHPDVYLHLADINGNRASRAAINATFAALERRLGDDPWLPLATTVNPSTVGAPFLALGRGPLDLGACSHMQPPRCGRAAHTPASISPECYCAANPAPQVFDQGSWGSSPYYPTTSPVDVPDAAYLSRYSSPVTVTPFYTW